MNKYLSTTDAMRRTLLEQAKERFNLPTEAVEKDLWVTQVLQILFTLPVSKHLIFKGGTSLSKAWHLIDLFSEDIDLAIDPLFLGFSEGDLTKKQIKKLRKASSLFILETLTEQLRIRVEEMGLSEWLSIDPQPNGEGDNTYPEPRQIFVHYKSALVGVSGYLHSDIVLEVSARSLLEPTSDVHIQSMLSEVVPIKDLGNAPIIVAVPGKTFLEKVFLLHELFLVEGHGLKAERKSRHLYDLYKMMDKDFATDAIKNDNLWEAIRHHREIYTSVNGVDYTPDVRKRIVLVPREDIIEAWRRDYDIMREAMIYGEKPRFDELIKRMRELEAWFDI
ncbi:MAG: nucleotidyl transferase AbiEii/AbiGii toxin family protein [Bacteroides sp.]